MSELQQAAAFEGLRRAGIWADKEKAKKHIFALTTSQVPLHGKNSKITWDEILESLEALSNDKSLNDHEWIKVAWPVINKNINFMRKNHHTSTRLSDVTNRVFERRIRIRIDYDLRRGGAHPIRVPNEDALQKIKDRLILLRTHARHHAQTADLTEHLQWDEILDTADALARDECLTNIQWYNVVYQTLKSATQYLDAVIPHTAPHTRDRLSNIVEHVRERLVRDNIERDLVNATVDSVEDWDVRLESDPKASTDDSMTI